jgi:ubiquinone/menaquinone biosynthesis C-methylase UbiE
MDYQEMVEAEWLPAKTADAYGKWSGKLAAALVAMTDGLIERARVRSGMRVLDVASGCGEPAIPLARAVGERGAVVATDLSEHMLALTRKNAAGISNMSFRVADAQSLPFDDASFDLVTCRLGIMYFVDVGRALREIRRVLRPGARVAFAAWGPPGPSETYSGFFLGPFFARKPPPQPPPDMPFPLRFAAPRSMAEALARAGFRDVVEDAVTLPYTFPGTPEEAWAAFYDVAVPMQPYLDGFTSDERAAAFREAVALLPRERDPERTDLTAAVNFAVATK